MVFFLTDKDLYCFFSFLKVFLKYWRRVRMDRVGGWVVI